VCPFAIGGENILKVIFALAGSLFLLCCGGGTQASQRTQPTQATHSVPLVNLFPLKDGTTWVFENPATGATLTIAWNRFDSSFCGDGGHKLFLSTWTKSDPANYWMPGADVLQHQLYYDDGTWVRSNGWWSNQQGVWFVQDMIQTGSEALYPIMLDTLLQREALMRLTKNVARISSPRMNACRTQTTCSRCRGRPSSTRAT
jgi:hypothetical protein